MCIALYEMSNLLKLALTALVRYKINLFTIHEKSAKTFKQIIHLIFVIHAWKTHFFSNTRSIYLYYQKYPNCPTINLTIDLTKSKLSKIFLRKFCFFVQCKHCRLRLASHFTFAAQNPKYTPQEAVVFALGLLVHPSHYSSTWPEKTKPIINDKKSERNRLPHFVQIYRMSHTRAMDVCYIYIYIYL